MINEGWGVVSQIGLWGWIACAIGFILLSFPHKESFLASRARTWGIGVVLFFLTWVVGMIKA